MERIERGERLTLRGDLKASDEDHFISLGTRWVNSRKIQSLVVRFPENKENLASSAIQFVSPEELLEEEKPEPAAEPVEEPAAAVETE